MEAIIVIVEIIIELANLMVSDTSNKEGVLIYESYDYYIYHSADLYHRVDF